MPDSGVETRLLGAMNRLFMPDSGVETRLLGAVDRLFLVKKGRIRAVLGGCYTGWNGRQSDAERRRIEGTGGPQKGGEWAQETRRMGAGNGVKKTHRMGVVLGANRTQKRGF